MSVYALHPGYVDTEITRNFGDVFNGCMQCVMSFASRFTAKTPEMGAQTTIYCATQPGLEVYSGDYFRYKFTYYVSVT